MHSNCWRARCLARSTYTYFPGLRGFQEKLYVITPLYRPSVKRESRCLFTIFVSKPIAIWCLRSVADFPGCLNFLVVCLRILRSYINTNLGGNMSYYHEQPGNSARLSMVYNKPFAHFSSISTPKRYFPNGSGRDGCVLANMQAFIWCTQT